MQDKILQFLRKNQGYISGEDISSKLNITRAAVWKNIDQLRSEGYEIIAVPHLGYQLISTPDILIDREIKYKLGTQFLGKRFLCYDTVESTMEGAFHLGLNNAPEGTVICAEGQTKGKGRQGRRWTSPKGKGIYVSIILRPKISILDVPKLTLLTAVSICETIRRSTNLDVKIKWPNDLLIGNKKVAGILTELGAETDNVLFIILGIGINVNSSASQLPANSTSLKLELSQEISRVELLKEILRDLEKWYSNINKQGFQKVTKRWAELSSTLNKKIKIDGAEGKAIGIDEHGGLKIRNDKGQLITKMTGDVVQA